MGASALIEALLRTPAARAVENRLFAPGQTLHAPHLLDVEVAQVIRRYAAKGEIDGERGRAALTDLSDLPLQRYPHDVLMPRVWELRNNLTAYDPVYVALAEVFEDEIEVRFFGHYQGYFDASVFVELQAARWVSVDCLTAISNEGQIAKLPLLNRLSFGVYQFDSPKFLEVVNVSHLKQLSLGETAKRNFDLEPLEGSRQLQTLFLEGHTNNVEVLSSLPKLAKLTLRAFPKHKNLQFLSDAASLRSLNLVLGGRSSFDEFHHAALEELSVILVRGLETLGSLYRFPRLQRLHVEAQLQVQSIDLAGAPLRRVLLLNCKGLTEVNGIEFLCDLCELRVSRTKLDLEALANRDWPASLSVLALYSGSRKWNEATRAMLDQRGYRESATVR